MFLASLLCLNHLLNITHKNNEIIKDDLEKLDKLKNIVVTNTPSTIIILNNKGIVEYVNPSFASLFGSKEVIGIDALSLDTVKNSNVYKGLIEALKGNFVELRSEHYTSCLTDMKKVLNIYITPVVEVGGQVRNIMVFIHDITGEYELQKQMEDTYFSVIEAFAGLIDAKDDYTGEHSNNVLKYVSRLCKELELDDKLIRDISLAAKIHDIGKIGVRSSILNKPGKLTENEYMMMKQHCSIGAEIIKKIKNFESISSMILHHHEKWDGTGYPLGLSKNKIPLGAQIIAIADAYDAMTSDRVYRKGLGKEKAKDIMIEEKGRQFNAELVDIFISKVIR